MNQYILEAHIELHKLIMEEVEKLVPSTKPNVFGREMKLVRVLVDKDGCLSAEYSRYMGCGETEDESVYLDPNKLFDKKDQS